jgi:phage-related baseplate assembly protein
MKSDLFSYLPDITFAERDPAVIERELINGYENAYQMQYGEERKLYPGDPIRLFLEAVAFELVHQRQIIDYTGKMNLLAYSETEPLDHLGAHLDVRRLPAQSALTTLQFTLSEPQVGVSIIPAGTRATPGGGDIVFATSGVIEIPEGETEAEITARCTIAGVVGNGFLPGQVKKIVDPFPWQLSVTNTTISAGGTDTESDENFRERIQIAPESFSVAGPRGAYESFARGAHQGIVDVSVVGPPETEPGHVEIYPLMKGGEIPPQEVLDAVDAICNAEDVRPDTDYVHVLPPAPVSYDLILTWWIDRSRATQAAAIQQAVSQAVQDWIRWQRSKLGRDINPSELNHRIIAAGAKRVEIASPAFAVISYSQVAVPGEVEVTFGGLEDG